MTQNQCIGVHSKLMDWFLYDRDLCQERVNAFQNCVGDSAETNRSIVTKWVIVLNRGVSNTA